MRSTPPRISPTTYPIAAAATARVYDIEDQEELEGASQASISLQAPAREAQRSLFSEPLNGARVIPFDQLTTAAERESIRARAAGLARPAPLKSEKVELPRARAQKRRSDRGPDSADQRRLDFEGREELVGQPQSPIIGDALVAPPALRLQAALLDGFPMAAGVGLCLAIFLCSGGRFTADKHDLPFLLVVLMTVPFFYKLLWTFVGRDSMGMQAMGLRLVDFDGNPPSKEHRYYRLFGSILSLIAAGLGLLWVFVDQDELTWHDHISNTFPTLIAED